MLKIEKKLKVHGKMSEDEKKMQKEKITIMYIALISGTLFAGYIIARVEKIIELLQWIQSSM